MTDLSASDAVPQGALSRLLRRKLALFGLAIIVLVVAGAVFAPWIARILPSLALLERKRRVAGKSTDATGDGEDKDLASLKADYTRFLDELVSDSSQNNLRSEWIKNIQKFNSCRKI